jgi:integrase
MLSIRKRRGRWYCRGTVKLGKASVTIDEHSIGTTERAAAESYKAQLQRDTERTILHGAKAARCEVTFDQAALNYLAGDRHLSDISRVRALTAQFSGKRLDEIDEAAFTDFCRQQIPNAKPATQRRAKSVLAAIFKCGGMTLPPIKLSGRGRTVIAWLSLKDADRLLASYPAHVRPIATVAAYCGLRASELLTLDRGAVDLARPPYGAIIVRNPKSGHDRIVPLHPRARHAIGKLCRDREPGETLFVNRYGQPYTDTRRIGGNPLSSSHKAACAKAGIENFRWHDWRHHFATWALRPTVAGGAGLDPLSLMMIGGWSSLDQVQRYGHANYETAAGQMSKRA